MSVAGARVELEVTNVAHGGVGVARLDGRVVFVADAIPGERVEAELTDVSRATFWRAATVRVLEASPHRREHVWAEASLDRAPAARAGGADFGHIDLAHQRELKRRVLAEALERFASVSTDVTVEPVCDGGGWRTRVRLNVGDEGVPGPFAARSHSVVEVASLPLAVPSLREVAPLSVRFEPGSVVDLVAPSIGDPLVLVSSPPKRGGRRRGDDSAPGSVVERVGDREFRVDADGFWQVHYRAAETLSAAVSSMIDRGRFDPSADNLDLYGGVGLLASAIADVGGAATRVTSVESSARATGHAVENLAWVAGARAVTARVDRFLRDGVGSAAPGATIVLDPPRSGAGREVVDGVVGLGPAQVVYVACDPVALARDVGYFGERGWRLESLRAFDLFPHTHHVESMALIVPDS